MNQKQNTSPAQRIRDLLKVGEDLDQQIAEIQRAELGPLEERAKALQVEIDGAKTLQDVHDFLGRFVAYPSPHARVAHTLWIAHAHLMDEWDSTPRLAFLSPENGSGKTRALELTETMVPNPVQAVNVSVAYLFRRISSEDGLPTILFDEVDTIFGVKAKESNEELRGLINAGHRRGQTTGRCVTVGKTIQTEDFPAYCAIAMAGIYDLHNIPVTILSRSVIVKMRRRAPGEQVEPYRRRQHEPAGSAIRDNLQAWAATLIGHFRSTFPDMPKGIEDRNADVWEPLLQVADAAGGDWPKLGREAAVALVAEAQQQAPSLGVRLLADLKLVFDGKDSMASEDINRALNAMEEAPWHDLRGKPIDPLRLANLLRPYGISSKNIRREGGVVKGYKREDLHEAWMRYLPTPAERATPATGATLAGDMEVVA